MEEKTGTLGHWEFCGTAQDNPYGFIYCITNIVNGRMYIGKKQCLSKRKLPKRKNKIKRVTKIVDTDWKTYTGSCKELNDDIQTYGKQSFKFEILRFCSSKWELGYYEICEQIKREVLTSNKYYNGIINCRLCKLKEYR